MSTRTAIIAAIDSLVANRSRPYGTWTIGVTDNPARRQGEHKSRGEDTQWWHNWDAETETETRDVEQYFLSRGMQGGSGGQGRADYVYVF